MLTEQPTREMLDEWKRIYNENRDRLRPNRKSGAEVNDYFRRKYHFWEFDSAAFRDVVNFNIMENEPNREKLPEGVAPKITAYRDSRAGIVVGIDLITGFFHVEGEDLEKVAQIHDDLFLFRGLDERDLKNCFLVAQYVQCLKEKEQ